MTSYMYLVPSVAPVGVVVTRPSDGLSMNISWSPLTLSQARGFVDYVITYGPPGGAKRQTLSKSLIVSDLFATVSGLEATGTYSVSVSGHTSAGQGPPSTLVTSVSPVPTPPPAGWSKSSHLHLLNCFHSDCTILCRGHCCRINCWSAHHCHSGGGSCGSLSCITVRYHLRVMMVGQLIHKWNFSSRRKGKLTIMAKTKDLFSPLDVISNSHRNSTFDTTGFFMEMKVKAEEEVVLPSTTEVVETEPDKFTEKESATATEGEVANREVCVHRCR